MLKMVCVLIVQLPIHVMNGAPEQTIHRKSEGDNKSERKRWRSMAVIMSMSGVMMEESGCDDNFACNWPYKWIKLTLKVSERGENVDEWKWWERRMEWRQKCMEMKTDEYSDDEGVYT